MKKTKTERPFSNKNKKTFAKLFNFSTLILTVTVRYELQKFFSKNLVTSKMYAHSAEHQNDRNQCRRWAKLTSLYQHVDYTP